MKIRTKEFEIKNGYVEIYEESKDETGFYLGSPVTLPLKNKNLNDFVITVVEMYRE